MQLWVGVSVPAELVHVRSRVSETRSPGIKLTQQPAALGCLSLAGHLLFGIFSLAPNLWALPFREDYSVSVANNTPRNNQITTKTALFPVNYSSPSISSPPPWALSLSGCLTACLLDSRQPRSTTTDQHHFDSGFLWPSHPERVSEFPL